MNSFPLYNQIVNNVPTSDLTPTEKEFFYSSDEDEEFSSKYNSNDED